MLIDLSLCRQTKQGTLLDPLVLLRTLGECSQKAFRSKLQWAQTTVIYLGHELSWSIPNLIPKHFQSILSIPLTQTKKQLHQFLGATGHCHQWISNFAVLAKRLHALLSNITSEPISWTF